MEDEFPFKQNDLVRLKVGGPVMQVVFCGYADGHGPGTPVYAKTAWWTTQHEVREHVFSVELLELSGRLN